MINLINLDDKQSDFLKRQMTTSFGRLVLARDKSSPIYSFGKEVSKKKPSNINPGPIYKVRDNRFDKVIIPNQNTNMIYSLAS